MGQMGGADGQSLLGGDPGDVTYPYYVVNGRIPEAPTTFRPSPANASGFDSSTRVRHAFRVPSANTG